MIMMQGTYYKEWSSVLKRDMEFKVYGTAGVPVLAMHAPFEVVSKLDCYETMLACKAIYLA